MISPGLRLLSVSLLLVVAPSIAWTQVGVSPSLGPSPTPTETASIYKTINFDRAVSEVPAFEALDLSPETVSVPTTPRDLATALVNGVDRNGVVQHGIAIDTAPFRLLPDIRTDIDAYRASALTRLLYNFSASLATSKASDKSSAVQLAVGFKAILYQSKNHDPYLNEDLQKAFDDAISTYDIHGTAPGQTIAPEDPVAGKKLQAAADNFRANSWKGMIWSAAIAPTWSSESGKISDLNGTGFTAWSTFSYGLQNPIGQIGSNDPINLQFIGQLRYRDGELVEDPNNMSHTAIRNSFIAAGRVRLGTTTFNGFAEAGYVQIWHGLDGDGTGWQGAVGVEKKITSNIWLVLSAGEQFGENAAKTNQLYAISSLRLGTADAAQFSAP